MIGSSVGGAADWTRGGRSCLFYLFLSLVFPEMPLFSGGFTPQKEGSWDSLTSQGPLERARLFFHCSESRSMLV